MREYKKYLEAEPSEKIEEWVGNEEKRLERTDALRLRKRAEQNASSHEGIVDARSHHGRKERKIKGKWDDRVYTTTHNTNSKIARTVHLAKSLNYKHLVARLVVCLSLE